MPQHNESKRILIIKLSSIGDVVMTTPVAKALRDAFPNAHISWLVEDRSKDIVIGNQYLDDVIVWNRQPGLSAFRRNTAGLFGDLAKLASDLRAREFDIAIDFQGLFRSAVTAWVSGANCRLGYDNAREGSPLFYTMRLHTRQGRMKGPDQYVKLLELLNIMPDAPQMHVPISDDDRAFARDFIRDADGKRIIAMCAGTTWPQKHWTDEGWANLADALISEHNALPVFLGAPSEAPLIDRIQSRMKFQAASAIGKTTLKQAAALIELSELAVAVDTGLLHIALALNRPSIGIFGPTGWKHMVKRDSFKIVSKELSCGPCWRHPTCSNFDCMASTTAEDVFAAVRPLLESRTPNPNLARSF